MLNEDEKQIAILLSDALDSLQRLNEFCDNNADALSASPNGPLFMLMMGADQVEWLKVRDRLELRLNEYLGRG
jgi:hypothetical protein